MEKGGDRGARDTPKKKARQRKAQGRKVQANLEDPREDLRENRKVGDTKESAGHVVELDKSRQTVDGELLASRRKMLNADTAEGRQPESEEDGEVGGEWIVGIVKEIEGRWETNENSARQRDEVTIICEEQRDGLREHRENRDDGFIQKSK